MEQLTLWSEEAPASRSPSPGEERAWMESLASCSSISELYQNFAQRGFSGRTSQAHYPLETTRSGSWSGKWLTSGMVLHGECWMLSSSEWPSAAAVCSLSDTLEEGGVPQRYSLSPKACAGILSRAERRGKSLPEPLASVLRAVASSSTRVQERGGVGYEREQSPTLTAGWHNPAVLSFAQNTRDEIRVQGDGDVSGALSAQPGMKQTTYVLQSDGSTSINSHGDGYQTDGSAYTLNCIDRQSVVCLQGGDVAGSLTARADSSPCVDRGQNVVCVPATYEYVCCSCGHRFTSEDGPIETEMDEDWYRIRCPKCGSGRYADASKVSVVCVADDNANAAMDVDMCGTLKVGGVRRE